jgi:hypothetical protein
LFDDAFLYPKTVPARILITRKGEPLLPQTGLAFSFVRRMCRMSGHRKIGCAIFLNPDNCTINGGSRGKKPCSTKSLPARPRCSKRRNVALAAWIQHYYCSSGVRAVNASAATSVCKNGKHGARALAPTEDQANFNLDWPNFVGRALLNLNFKGVVQLWLS